MVFDATSNNCLAPKLEHFAGYDVSTTVKEMNKKLCLFESVSEDFSDKWNFQCHNSNIALVCMGNNAIGHELREHILMGSAEPGGSISGPLIISIMALSVLINLVCFVVIARLVKTAREKGATTPLQTLKRAFANQEPHPPPPSSPENGTIIKDSVKNSCASNEVFLEDSDGNVVKI